MNNLPTAWKPLDALPPGQRAAELAARGKVEAVARDFEALWLDRVMAVQRATVSRNEMFDGGRGEEIFQARLDGEFARIAAQQGTTIGGMLRESLIRSMGGYATRAYGGAK